MDNVDLKYLGEYVDTDEPDYGTAMNVDVVRTRKRQIEDIRLRNDETRGKRPRLSYNFKVAAIEFLETMAVDD